MIISSHDVRMYDVIKHGTTILGVRIYDSISYCFPIYDSHDLVFLLLVKSECSRGKSIRTRRSIANLKRQLFPTFKAVAPSFFHEFHEFTKMVSVVLSEMSLYPYAWI
jgi:hypothetical protein